jgi:hypothetical protein
MSGAGIDQGLAAQHPGGATPAAWSLIETIGPSQTRSPWFPRHLGTIVFGHADTECTMTPLQANRSGVMIRVAKWWSET